MSSSLERENARLRAERNDLRAVVQAKEGTIRGLEVAHANAETAVQRLDDLGRQVVDLTRESDHFQRCLDRASDELDRAYARIRELEAALESAHEENAAQQASAAAAAAKAAAFYATMQAAMASHES